MENKRFWLGMLVKLPLVVVLVFGMTVVGCDNGGGTTGGGGDTPVLSAGSVSRTSDTAAAIAFTTDKAGTAYYLVQNSGAAAPANTAVKARTPLGAVIAGANSGKAVTLTAGAKDIYVVVEDASGNISSPLKIQVEPYTASVSYNIGDTGPAGGIIFYVNADGFTMTGVEGICHYLEASPVNLTGGTGSETTMRWSTATGPYLAVNGTLTTIGSGKNNTAIIIAAEFAAYPGNTYIYAAKACSEYRGGGKDDWFLPSKDELNELYKAEGKPGIPTTGWIWSSSQSDYGANYAWVQGFDYGTQYDSTKGDGTKDYDSGVRAVRAFCGNGTTGGAPVLSAGSVNRTSDTAAAIGFTTDKAGTAYYIVQDTGAAAPAKTAVQAGTSLGAVTSGANSDKAVTLTAGAKDIYVVVEDASGNISSPLKIQVEPYTASDSYNIGDIGPAGGIIFYVSADGFTMTGVEGTCHYLEASPANLTGGTGSQTAMRWSTATAPFFPITVGTLTTIGSGKNNTAIIIAAESAAYPGNTYIYAARACSEYRGGGKDDWFLPSKDELNELYKAKTGISTTGWFWSSSQSDGSVNFAYDQNFANGVQTDAFKSYDPNVRAIRAFCGNGTTDGGDTTSPVLSAGSVNRTSDTAAAIGFTTDKAGTAYYIVQDTGAAAPVKTAVQAGTSLGAVTSGANSDKAVTLTAGAKDIYVVVEDSSGNISDPLKIEVMEYYFGAPGPAGGIIFYVSEEGFTMTGIAGTCHYLEASSVNLTGGTGIETTMRWSTATPYPAVNGTLETVGSGKNNTAIIIAAESAAYPGNTYIYAARACSEYRGGGKDDWFLPSKDELNELFNAEVKLDIPRTGFIWSSSQYDGSVDGSAWLQEFYGGSQVNYSKNSGGINVRAIRAFCDNGTNSGGDTTMPVLYAGSVNRTSDTAAAIGFTPTKAGTAYYIVQDTGAAAPAKTAVKAGTSLGAVTANANSGKAVTLTAGAKDIYVVVEDASGNISSPLKIEVLEYYIGATGPAGGIIFYVSEEGFTMTGIAGTCHYLEASPANLTGGTGSESTMRWSTAIPDPFPVTFPVTNGTLETIGSGKNNTAIIIAAESAAYPGNTYIYAARACSEYRGGGKNDWFLPSKDELNELFKAEVKLDIPRFIWSSSQFSYDSYAWSLFFSGALQGQNKADDFTVYAVRAF